MANIKVKIKVRDSFVETHEITMDKDTFDNIGINDSMYDYISDDTLIDRECIETDYDIIERK